MKARNLLLGMFTCAALVACSDNDPLVDNNVLNPDESGVKVPAYMTLSIAPSTEGTRGNTEDPANPEDTGITNAGTTAENTVTSILWAIYTTDNTGNPTVEKEFYLTETTTPKFSEAFKLNTSGLYEQQIEALKPVKVEAGDHKILVVLNPVDGNDTFAEAMGLEVKGENGAEDVVNEGKFTTMPTYLATGGGAAINHHMMANRVVSVASPTTANTEDNPYIATVDVERSVAKIMYRPYKATGEAAVANTYTVNVPTVKNVRVTKEISGVTYYQSKDQANKTVYYTEKDGENGTKLLDKVYSIAANDVTTVLLKWDGTGATPSEPYYTCKDTDETKPNQYIVDNVVRESSSTPNTVTIKLTDYVLSNMQNKSWVIRHTSNDGTKSEVFGQLTGSNYLYDCYFAQKSQVSLDGWAADPKEFQFSSIFNVPFATLDPTDEDIWTSMASMTNTDTEDGTTTGDTRKVGYFMSYAFENAAIENMQKHGFSTSITFRAKATMTVDGTETAFDGYTYKGVIYKTAADLAEATGLAYNATDKTWSGYPENDDDRVSQYVNGICYYTTQLKHYDNGLPSVMGNMEFAIVRNNIYSLQVENLSGMGDSEIDTDPNVDDETGDAYIKLQVKILPWIVRYNQIKF